jgi:hypothetical protein
MPPPLGRRAVTGSTPCCPQSSATPHQMPNRILASGYASVALLAFGCAFSVAADLGPPPIVESLPTTIDEICKERFLRDAPPAWRKVRDRLRGIELEHTYIDHRPSGKDQPDQEVYSSTYCVMKDGEGSITRLLERDKKIDVANSRYCFTAERAADAYAMKPFSLKACESWKQGDAQPLPGHIEAAEAKFSMFSNVWWLPIEKVLADSDFKVIGADCRVGSAGDEVVRMVFRYDDNASNDYFLQPDGVYWVELLPSRFWAVWRSGVTSSVSKHVDTDAPFWTRVTTGYQEWDGVPLPKEVRIEVVDGRTNALVRVQENRFGPPSKCTRSSEEFFLPYYGFADDPLPSIPYGCR